jgi:type IV pilus assembly protein PilW
MGTVFESNKMSYRMNEGIGRLQEAGRFTMEYLTRELRMAGYRNPNNGALPTPFYSDCTTLSGAVCTTDGGGNNSDQVAIQYEPPSNQDCTGAAVPAGDLVVNVLSISGDALWCRGYDQKNNTWFGAADELISGVENMQVLYGEGTGNGDVTRYISADKVTDWANVLTVRLALLASSEAGVSGTSSGQKYVLLDAPPITAGDTLVRRLYTTTITLRNLLP